jgi:HD-GYP domain-containing protein (c-di-GMP phosphodiesterase class II)
MRLGARTFLWSFLPVALLLTGSFWTVQRLVVREVRQEFRASLRETQSSLARMRSAAEQRNRRILKVVAENPALKNGLQLALQRRGNAEAQRTLEDQLMEMGEELGFEVLSISDAVGKPLAGAMRERGRWTSFDPGLTPLTREGYFAAGGKTYQASSAPVDLGDENLGTLTVGERFELSSLPVAAILTREGKIVESHGVQESRVELQSQLAACSPDAECEARLGSGTYLFAPMEVAPMEAAPPEAEGAGAEQSSLQPRPGKQAAAYRLRSVVNLDSAARPIQAMLRNSFSIASILALAGAVILSWVSSRSIVRPISEVVARLREGEATGELPDFPANGSGPAGGVQEIRELRDSFARASAAVREGRERLREAGIEFIQSLASALDARDPYTAGHSRRVSQYACAIARSRKLPPKELEEVRVGALLHDIGKIGIADSILQKPGRLSEEENRLIQEHPSIGRKILEGVQGLQPYLGVVELHHENWDGTGYPHGLRREEAPLAARIVKIADAYDAMTSDRPYRRGMPHEEALALIAKFAGTQMDPNVVEVFLQLGRQEDELGAVLDPRDSLHRLAEAVGVSNGTPAAAGRELAGKEKS